MNFVALFLIGLVARAEDVVPQDVRVAVRGDAVVNWTRLSLEVTASARGFGVESNPASVEQEARRAVGPGMLAGVHGVQVTTDKTEADLEKDPRLGDAIRSRVERWAVPEATYYASGKVELLGELSLQELLKPWTMSVARPVTGEASDLTGIVVDARGSGLVPAYAPRIMSADGEVLYDGLLWQEEAARTAPAVYVSDPAHPAAARAGAEPLRVRADAAEGSDAWLTAEDSARFRVAMANARVLGEGKMVIVVGQ